VSPGIDQRTAAAGFTCLAGGIRRAGLPRRSQQQSITNDGPEGEKVIRVTEVIGTRPTILDWKLSPGAAVGCSLEPPIVYTVTEVTKGRKDIRFEADMLSEVGRTVMGSDFRTIAAAQKFCETRLRHWRKQRKQNGPEND
jgi:hypothetical protein